MFDNEPVCLLDCLVMSRDGQDGSCEDGGVRMDRPDGVSLFFLPPRPMGIAAPPAV